MKKSFSIINLGCPRNLVDSESIASEFKRNGYAYREDVVGSQTVIINTCAFIEDAKKESIEVILKAIDLKKNSSIKKVIVAGCLVMRYGKELKKGFKEIDEFRGIWNFQKSFNEEPGHILTPGHYAYIKLSEGCRNRCTYCIIPRIKGPYRSKEIGSVIKEAKFLIQGGVREIVLVGQDTSLYGIDLYGKKRLSQLLRALEKASQRNWIRILYSHPKDLDREAVRIIGDSKSICKYIDLPIEHISDEVLKKMGRGMKKRDISSLIEYIRRTIKGVSLRTSIIVGFPGETERDFKELLSFIKEIRFERLGLFRYSREEDTPAYGFKGQISEREKERRFNEVMALQQDIAREVNEKFKGKIIKVLIDEKEGESFIGRSEYDAPEVDGVVYVRGKDLKIGNFYNVRIIDTYEYDLVGKAESVATD